MAVKTERSQASGGGFARRKSAPVGAMTQKGAILFFIGLRVADIVRIVKKSALRFFILMSTRKNAAR